MPESERQDFPSGSGSKDWQRRASRLGSIAILAACVGFIGDRLIQLKPAQLLDHASWPLGAAMVTAPLLFAASDKLLASAWSSLASANDVLPSHHIDAIYARGVLAKYLPGSVFQYASRQVDGAAAGLAHKKLAKASAVEIALHLPASMVAAASAIALTASPAATLACGMGAMVAGLCSRDPVMRAGALQFAAFLCFGVAAAVVGAALLPTSAPLGLFSGLFLLSWLAGFLVPVAPGGLGVREAALIALAGTRFPDAPLLASVLALRIASLLGDILFGTIAILRFRLRGNVRSSIKSP